MPNTMFEVLVVEDESILRLQLEQLIALWGYQVRSAGDVASALAHLDLRLPDIILTDLMLPDSTGYALLEQSQARRPGLPVLVMTGFASLESAIEALKQGAYDYLLKPVTPPELAAALARAVTAVSLQRSRERVEHLRHIAEVALTLAHEINNPLAVIMGELQLQLEAGVSDEECREAMDVCIQSTHRIADVVRKISALQEVVYEEYGSIRLLDLEAGVG